MKFIYIFMLAVTLFVLGIALAGPINDVAAEQMDIMNCSSENITNMEQGACTQINLIPSWIIGVILGLAGSIIGGKVL